MQVVWSWLLRPDEPRVDNRGKRRKYENVTGEAWRPFYILPADADRVLSSSAELWITEGVFDALALESKGCAALGLTAGTWGWCSDRRPHDDWARVHLRERPVKIAFDADQIENPQVRLAAVRLKRFLITRGAVPENIEVVGAEDLSDYIAKGGIRIYSCRTHPSTTSPSSSLEKLSSLCTLGRGISWPWRYSTTCGGMV
jgi:hypothetical protein